ncbi:SUKH-4 family immunity protein [Streptomyces sp. NPDC059994]|uniref:SUKH-4 family immunity protein n=2 Tax=unclassified Streptomyces TaxID=2593676 RepID=UPI00369679FD
MPEASSENWPTFEMVQLHGPHAEDPNWDGPDLMLEVPRGMLGAAYQAASSLTQITQAGNRRLVKFGSTGLFGSILLDAESGIVVKLEKDAGDVGFVNSSLSAFAEAVEMVIEKFPFYGSDCNDDDWATAARGMENSLRSIDPISVSQDSFWGTFISDVEIGDYSTEDVLG